MEVGENLGGEAVHSIHVCFVCGDPAEHRCSACKSVAYCTKEHQKKDWKTHKLACKPPPFEVGMNDELGRYLVATRDLSPGDVIISEPPVMVGPRQVSIPLCLGCYSVCPKVRCSQCHWPLCSLTCEGRDHLEHHGVECSALAQACAPIVFDTYDETHYAYECVMVLRCILLQRRSPRRWRQILDMVSHEDKRGKGTEVYDDNQIRVVGFLRNFVGLANWDTKRWDVSEATIHRVCGILDVNALEMRISESSDLQALYSTASLLEHSCVPNVRMVFDDKLKLTVSAAVPIKKGEHIKTMYTHALWGTQARRDHLRQNKYFLCACERCADPTELGTNFSSLRCLQENCTGYLMPEDPLQEKTEWVCSSRCGGSLSSYHVTELAVRLGDEVEGTLATRADLSTLQLLLDKLARLTHPQHYHQFAVKHSLVQLLARGESDSSEEEERRKVALCEEMLSVIRVLDPGSTRLAVYEAVLCVELHSARLKVARRHPDPEHLMAESRAAKALLERAVHVLRHESNNLPEGKLSDVAKTALQELNECFSDMKVDSKS